MQGQDANCNFKFSDSKFGSCFFWGIFVQMVLQLTFPY